MNLDKLKATALPKVIGAGVNAISIFNKRKAASIALDLFRSPKKGAIKSHQKKFLAKFKSTDLSVDGRSIKTYDNGKSGRRVLLCHGWESNSFRWRKLYRELKNTDINIIMLDAPAHGDSGSDRFDAIRYAAYINKTIEHYRPSIVVGHSVGGYSVLYSISTYRPPSVEKLVILASPDKFTDITDRYFRMLSYSARVRRAYDQLVEEIFGGEPESFSVARHASTLSIPGLIIHDKGDMINEYYEGETIHKAWPKSRMVTTEGLGHGLQDLSVYQEIIEYICK